MKKFIAWLLVIGIFSLAALPAYGASGAPGNTFEDPSGGIYVSPTGNDTSASGQIGAPFKSINAALAVVEPGDTLILRGGTYREGENVRIRTPDITIKSAKGEWAVIDLTTYSPGCDEDSGVYFDVDSSGGRLQGVEVVGGVYAVCLETKWDWGDPADRAGASDIVIENCVLHDSRYDVVKVKPNCDNIIIRNNEIYNSGMAFAGNVKNGEDNAEGIDIVNGDNVTVQNNYIHDICSNAVYAKGGATDALIENNRIERAYGGGILVGFDTSPEFFDTDVNPQYYENIRGVVRNNLIIDTGWEGIGFYASKDAQVYNNTLVNVANGGQYHSALYFGLSYQDWEPYAGRPANVGANIHHNIISQPSDNVRPMIEIRYANELGGLPALDDSPTMNDNCYYIAGKSASFSDLRPRNELDKAGLSAWQSHIGGDGGSIEADPGLDTDYMPTNPLCTGMGIMSDLSMMSDGSNAQNLPVGLGSASDWARDSITAAISKGFVPADLQGSYKDVITRLEFCRMAVKWVEYATGKDIDALLSEKGLSRDPDAFNDTNDSDVLAAFALGITGGTGIGRFSPEGEFDRQQAARMIMNTCSAIGANVDDPPDSGFADLGNASDWAIDGINFVRANGIMQGTGSNNFSPLEYYTREQSIITLNNIRFDAWIS